ncbi:MAG: DUF2085 domain-containing protein [Balneolaceae bacterium]
MQLKWLYVVTLAMVLFVVAVATGKALWGGEPGSLHWSERLFQGICHRIPSRTYHLNELPMAVNTRCFGVFAGLAAGWLAIPIMGRALLQKRWPLWFLVLALLIQIFDVGGNIVSIWTNTNHSRFLLGSLLGLAMAASVAGQFFNPEQRQPSNTSG